MSGNLDLEPISHQLKVGDILELILIDERFTAKPIVEIPINSKHVTKSHIFLDFQPQTLSLSLPKPESKSKHNSLDITIDHMDIFDPEKAYVATYDQLRSWRNQLVRWKKLPRD